MSFWLFGLNQLNAGFLVDPRLIGWKPVVDPGAKDKKGNLRTSKILDKFCWVKMKKKPLKRP